MVVLILTDHGSKIQSSKEMFKISYGISTKPPSFIAAVSVESIIINANISITSGAFSLIQKYSTIIYWHNYSDPGMILLPVFNNGMTITRKAQYIAITTEVGVNICKEIVIQSCLNRVNALKSMDRSKRKFVKEIADISVIVEETIQKVRALNADTVDLIRENLMALEAIAARHYWQLFDEIMTSAGWNFDKRSRRPAKNEINALLNYGYAVLKGTVTSHIVVSGLDIYAGFLHTDRSGRQSLVLDMMELFRQIFVDEIVHKLISQGKIEKEMFDRGDNGIELTKEAKEIFLGEMFSNMKKHFGEYTLEQHILLQSQSLVNYLRGKSQKFKTFRHQVIR